ncbi:MAG TPA: hypothetical protein VK636_17060 [Gemmatimonadaceae bacterium]|nr:hypothetical protein [Gemmatimonadaceae bacterium]
MRTALGVLTALVIAAPLAAQARAGDPTTQVKGTGKMPASWQMRFDPTPAGRPAPTPDQVVFEKVDGGFNFTSGPAAIYYNPKDMGKGEYAVSATFSQKKSVGHEAYGIFIGGKNLQDSTQTYIYFVIKPCRSRGDCKEAGAQLGEALVSQRQSDGKPVALVPTAHSDLVQADDPTDGHATNKLLIHVAADSIHFVLNDKLFKAVAKSDLHGATTDGQAGIRINHNINVKVDWKGVD